MASEQAPTLDNPAAAAEDDEAADGTPAGGHTAEAAETAAEDVGTAAKDVETEAGDVGAAAVDEVSDCDAAVFGWVSFRRRHGGVLNWRRGRTVSARRR